MNENVTFSKTRMVEHEGVRIEKNCCMILNNKKFCSGGAVISEKYILAYMSSDGTKITNWDGSVTLCTDLEYTKLRDYFNPFDIYGLTREAFYLRFLYKGRIYSGLCMGNGCIVKARLTKMKDPLKALDV